MLDYHGREGYLSVSDGTATPLNKEVYARAMEELGYSTVDCNGKSQIGKCYKYDVELSYLYINSMRFRLWVSLFYIYYQIIL